VAVSGREQFPVATRARLITYTSMSPVDLSAQVASDGTPEGLVAAGDYATYADAFEHSVVVLATEHCCWLVPFEDRFRLLVEPQAFAHVHEQLARYDRERIGWPPRPISDHTAGRNLELITPLLWGLVVLLVFRSQAAHPEWVRAGVLDPAGIFDRGEWWRPVTALFFHADPAHVLSNLLSGVFVFSAVVSSFGRLRGWLLLSVAAIVGNVAVAGLNYSHDYRSLGASTAVFAALGVLTGRAIRVMSRAHRPHRWRAVFVPLAAGLTVLALYGAGGGNVDVLAHLSGFLAGLVCGFIGESGKREMRRESAS
jgi:membrane associated rhomboid family serine protease